MPKQADKYIFGYDNENEFKKLESALKKYNMLAFKKLYFEFYPSLKSGVLLGEKVTVIKNGTKQIVYVCPSDFDNGGSYNSFVTCVKTMPNYVTKNTYKNVTYYRYRDRTYKNNNNTYKWSSCNDSSLTSQGFVATGKTK